MAPILAIGNGMEAQLDLNINNVFNGSVLNLRQLLLPSFAIGHVYACLEEAIGAEERA